MGRIRLLRYSQLIGYEFDTYNNTDFKDPDGNHLTVFSNGNKPNSCTHKSSAELNSTSNILTFKADSTTYYGKIEYNNQLKTLQIWLDKAGDFSEPVLTIDSIELSKLLELIDNKEAYVGFTSATEHPTRIPIYYHVFLSIPGTKHF